MSTYYGQVKGNAETTASRRGTEQSGLRVSAQSYNGSVILVMKNGCVDVEIAEGSSIYGHTEFSWTIEELKKALRFWKEGGGANGTTETSGADR